MKGRKPVPCNVVQMRGNPGKRPIRDDLKTRGGKPRCPKWFTTEQRVQFRKITRELRGMGIEDAADEGLVVSLAVVTERVHTLTKRMNEFGDQYDAQPPARPYKCPVCNGSAEYKGEECHGCGGRGLVFAKTAPKLEQWWWGRELRQQIDQATKLSAELGLTPTARARIGGLGGKTHSDNPFNAI